MKSFRSKVKAGFTLVEIMIVVLIIGILLAIAIPNFVSARESSRAKACIGNLKQLDSAVQQYAMDSRLSSTDTLSSTAFAGLAPTYIRTFPKCPEGGTYNAPPNLQESPFCTISDKSSSGDNGGSLASGDAADYGTTNGVVGKWAHSLP